MSTEPRYIAELRDREAIRELRMAYSQHLDSGNITALGQVFTPDAELQLTIGTMQGLAHIQAGLRDAFQSFDRDRRGRYPFLHVVANHQVQMTSPDTAEGQCYLIDFETASKPDPNPLLLLGLYRDRYRKTADGWRIEHSQLAVVWPPEASTA